jgi:class 3 adenylate cyclase
LAAREYQGRPGFLAGIHLRDGELIGCVGLVDQPLTVHYFFDPAHWGRGYATEALVPFVDWCAAQFGFDELRVGVVDVNIGSRRVLEKAGFKLTHAARHQSDVREEPDRLLMYWKGFGAPEPLGTRTERLHLHPIHTGHATRISELGNDPAVARMLTFMALPFTPDHAREWIAANQDDPDTFQLAISTLEGRLVGTGTIEIAGSTGRLSGWIGKPYWNDGLGYEALQGLAAIAFNRFAERARANLVRYFSPKLVETLAAKDQPLGAVRRQNLAVLFADVVGFTRLSETLEPELVMELLRDIHGWMEKAIFQCDGSIEGYIGDAVLAIFGFPEAGAKDASNALSCAYELLIAAQVWNQARAKKGLSPIHIGIGLHYGPVVLGDVGTEEYVEFTVIGDTVNTASRLQQAARTLQCDLVVGQELVNAVKDENEREDTGHLLGRLQHHGDFTIRGRSKAVEIWTSTLATTVT